MNQHYSTLISASPDTFRASMRRSFQHRFEMDEKAATNVEIGVYNYAIREANKERIVKKWENKNFTHLYMDRMRSLWMNLQQTDNSLLERWQRGEINPEQMSSLTHQEMNGARWQSMIEQKMKRDAHSTEMRASTDMFTCKKCKSKKCSYYELQTRSADEPSTIFISCLDCGKNWKQ